MKEEMKQFFKSFLKKLLIMVGVIAFLAAAVLIFYSFEPKRGGTSKIDPSHLLAKPVIYLYPEEETSVKVKLEHNGQLVTTYPEYDGGWYVTAYPDGRIVDTKDGNEYSYLFWEGDGDVKYDLSRGYLIKGEDTADFLRRALSEMGLLPREYNEFIVYWLPLMQNNDYNFITFQNEAYKEAAKLYIDPSPDSLLRIFMAYKPVDSEDIYEYEGISAPEIKGFERKGFTVVEWGGTEIN